jgi:succinate-semialdehyde dehydrogenase / glutarate-semialdehyde dehydrogenase
MSARLSAVDNGTVFIDGKWRHAASDATFTSRNPATSEPLGLVSDAGPAEATEAIAAASAAADSWAARTAYERAALLTQAHALMTERADELALLMTAEQGKPLRAARNEVGYAADFLMWFAEEAKRVYGSTIPSARGDQRFITLHQPVGVVAAITPWNYPMSMITRKVGPALAAGCPVVLKPAEQTPLCAVAVVQLLEDAGLPPGVCNLLTTSDPAPVGRVLLASEAVRKLTFTGSTEVGKQLAADAAGTVKRVSLELGGHAPFLVFNDADPVHAAKGAALVKFLNTGQACISPNRIFVQRDIYPQFLDALSARVAALRAGNGAEAGITIGPLIDEGAVQKMERHVSDAIGKGAGLLAGGGRLAGDGYDAGTFFAPTLLSDVTPEMLIYREETFGPVAAVTPFDHESQAIEMANDTAYGLASYVYTRDLSRAFRVSEALRFAIVGVNDINPTSAAAPFGGMKESGLGREGGRDGITEYLETKLIGLSV